jgi:DNA-binding GntR family transcriptional regulator
VRQNQNDMMNESPISVGTSGYKTLQDIIYENLRDDILSGKLSPDTPLNTSELSRQTNISRTPIREAINKLASIGLVQKINHREAKVASFLSDEIHEIYYMRAALEGIAARMAAKNMSQKDKLRLLDLTKDTCEGANEMTDEHFFETNFEFHHLIYSSIKTPLIREIIDQFYAITQRYRKISYDLDDRKTRIAEEHSKIAQYIYEGNEIEAYNYGYLHHANTISIIDDHFKKE